jgi:hypothetical protein
MFRTKRKEHHQIVQTLAKMPTDVKRYKAVQMLMEQVFKVGSSRERTELQNDAFN